MEVVQDKERIRYTLKELATQEPNFVSDLMAEVAAFVKAEKRRKLEQIVNEDFTEYEGMFRRLA
jgi:hypothetical protein